MKKILSIIGIMAVSIVLVGCNETIDDPPVCLKTEELVNGECILITQDDDPIDDDPIDDEPNDDESEFGLIKYNLSASLLDILNRYPFNEIAYISDIMVAFTSGDKFIIAEEEQPVLKYTINDSINDIGKQKVISYDPETGILLYVSHHGIYKLNTNTELNTQVLGYQDDYIISVDGGASLKNQDIEIFDKNGEIIESFTGVKDFKKIIKDGSRYYFITGYSTCDVYGYDGTTQLYHHSLDSGCDEIVYADNNNLIVLTHTETEQIFTAFDSSGSILNEVRVIASEIYYYMHGNVLKIDMSGSYFINLENANNATFEMDVEDSDEGFVYGRYYGYDLIKVNNEDYNDIFEYTGFTYIDVQKGYVYVYGTPNDPYLGNLYSPENELIIEDIYSFNFITDTTAIYIKNESSVNKAYLFDSTTNESIQIGSPSIDSIVYFIYDGFIMFIDSYGSYSTQISNARYISTASLTLVDFEGNLIGNYTQVSFFGRMILRGTDGIIYEIEEEGISSNIFGKLIE